jgi:Fanconi anemia group M protein
MFGPANKITLLKTQTLLAMEAKKRSGPAMMGMSLTAQAIKISHALELLETQSIAGLYSYLKSLQEQANQKKSKGVQRLVKEPEFNAALISLEELRTKQIEHPKIEELAVLAETEFQENEKAKIIIFTQFRDTASAIVSRLEKIPQASPALFLGQAKRTNKFNKLGKTTTTGLSQKEQKAVIEDFKSGKINILVATSIGEEGLDIPEVSAVVFYEPIPSAIRKIQRAGRTARLKPGKLFILITKDTRDVAYHYASAAREKKMFQVIENIQKELSGTKKSNTLDKFI